MRDWTATGSASPLLAVVAFVGAVATGCPTDQRPEGDAGGDAMLTDTGGETDAGPAMDATDNSDGSGDTARMDGGPDGDASMDGGMDGDSGMDGRRTHCQDLQPPSGDSLCRVQSGNSDELLLVGDVLTDEKIYDNGAVLVDRSGSDNATISCSGCGCQSEARTDDPTVITCPEGVISPALVNAHDHLGWAKYGPADNGTTRYDHRNEWRRGIRGKQSIDTPSSDYSREAVLYGELRHLFGGATVIAGSSRDTTDQGLLRNLDNPNSTEGIDVSVDYSTFPLGDSDGTVRTDNCAYPRIESYGALRHDIYLPHVSEGIDDAAQNEFNCLSKHGEDARDLTEENTSIVHGIGMSAEDVRELAANGGNLVWSPRTNISLYGHTADVHTYRRYDVPVSLGTDWPISGSMNMLRELACVDYLNSNHYNGRLSERAIWKMATSNGAVALGVEDKLGRLAENYIADVAIFDAREVQDYGAVVTAGSSDLHLVMRGGEPLLGDAALVDAMVPQDERDKCTDLDVCGNPRQVCVNRDTEDNKKGAVDLSAIKSASGKGAYPLFSCDISEVDEPTCVPSRPSEFDGMSTPMDSDGDGVADSEDSCPDQFNPPRPLADGQQPDTDGDGQGDPCDPCPTSKENDCAPDDYDGDGITNADDNCPWTDNRAQADGDGDGLGDACDRSTTIYDIHNGAHPAGDEIHLDEVVVTATNDSSGSEGIFVQVPPDSSRWQGAAKSGMFVFLGGGDLPERGDLVSIEGRVVDYHGLTQISAVTKLEVVDSDHTLPQPETVSPCDVATGGSKANDFIGALIRVENVSVTDSNPDKPDDYGEFAVGDCMGMDGLRVDDELHTIMPAPEAGDSFHALIGPLYYAFNNTKLEPRDDQDVLFGPADLKTIEPTQSFIKSGTSGVPLPNFEVVLTRPSAQPTTVNLSYKNPTMLDGPASVTVPANQTRAQVMLNAKQAASSPSDFAVVEASVGGGMPKTAKTLVYNDQLPRALDDFSTKTKFAQPTQSFTVSVRLNVPAPSGGTTVNLSTNSDLDLPSSPVTIPADTFETTFQVGAGSNTTKKTLTATVGQSTQSLSITVKKGPTGDCLIISEYIEGSGRNNKAIELYNCGASTLTLEDFGVCLFSNKNTTCSGPAMLTPPSGGSSDLQPGEVHTLCRTAPSSGPYDDPVERIAKQCDQEASTVMNHNGNDRLLVFEDKDNDDNYNAAVDAVVDALGKPAQQPSGSPWSDKTLRRCNFQPYKTQSPFNLGDYYTEHPQDDASDYGTPPMSMGCPMP